MTPTHDFDYHIGTFPELESPELAQVVVEYVSQRYIEVAMRGGPLPVVGGSYVLVPWPPDENPAALHGGEPK